MKLIMTYPTMEARGGGVTASIGLACALADIVDEVTIVSSGPPSGPLADLAAAHPRVHLELGLNWGPAELRWISIASVCRRILGRRRHDAVLSWGMELVPLVTICRRHNVLYAPIAANMYREWRSGRYHGVRLRSGPPNLLLLNHAMKRCDVVLAVSRATEAQLRYGLGIDRTAVITHGVPQSLLRLPRAKRTGASRRVLFFGSWAPVKGLEDAIEAVALVQRISEAQVELRIAGWGDRHAVSERLLIHGVRRAVILGSLEPDEIAHELRHADVALLPSRAEPFGLSIAEAMAAAVPVVSYAIDNVLDTVGHAKAGWLVDCGDRRALAHALLESLAGNEGKRRGEAGRAFAREHFRWDLAAHQVLQALDHASQRKMSQAL